MSYENLNSTKMLATRCCVCGRALRDAVSAEMGIGPDCREKYGYGQVTDEAARRQANQLIYLIADKQVGVDVVEATRQLRNLGFTTLAGKIAHRLFSVRIQEDKGYFVVTGPYNEMVPRAFRNVPGRRWDKDLCANIVPTASKQALWAALKVAYPGYTALAPSGDFFKIPDMVA